MRPLPHLRIIRFPKKRVAFCSAAKEGGRGGRLKTCPHGLLLLFFSGLTDPGRLCPYPGFPLFDPAPACIPAAQPETHPAQPRARGFPLQRGKPTQSKEKSKWQGAAKGSLSAIKASPFSVHSSLLWFCGRRPPSRGAVRGPGRAPGLERTNTASAALFFISIGSPWRAGTGRCAAPCAKAAAVFPGPAKARRALPGFSWGAPFGGKSAFGRKKSSSLEKSRIFLFCEKRPTVGDMPARGYSFFSFQ